MGSFGPALGVGFASGRKQREGPDHAPGGRLQRGHAAGIAGIGARGADEHEPVPGDRGGGDRLCAIGGGELGGPDLFAVGDVVGDHVAVGRAPKYPVAFDGDAPGSADPGHRRQFVLRPPSHRACARIDGIGILKGGEVEDPAQRHQPAFKHHLLRQFIGAHLLQPGNVLGGDIGECRKSRGSVIAVVHRPIR